MLCESFLLPAAVEYQSCLRSGFELASFKLSERAVVCARLRACEYGTGWKGLIFGCAVR